MTFALLDNDDRAITVGEGRQILEPLLEYVGVRKLPVTSNVDLSRRGELRKSIERLISEGVVDIYDKGTEAVLYVPRDKQHEAAFYRNTIIHFFVTRAITELALLDAAEEDETDLAAATWERAKRFKDLLKFEFFFPSTADFAKDVSYETSLVFPGWESVELDRDLVLTRFHDLKLHLAHRVLAPFLEAYALLFDRLAARPAGVEVEDDSLVAECLDIAQQRWLQHLLHSPESISKDLFVNALKLADNLGVLEPGGPEIQAQRIAIAQEFRRGVELVSQLRHLAREQSRDFLRKVAIEERGF